MKVVLKWGAWLASAMLLTLLSSSVQAALTPINPNGGGNGSEPSLTAVGGILDTFYGLANLQRIADTDAPITDQVWQFVGTSATVKIDVRYAGDTSAIGAATTGGGSPVDLFRTTSKGVNPNVAINAALGPGVISFDSLTKTITLYNNGSSPVYNPFTWTGHDLTKGNLWSSAQNLNNGTLGYTNDPGYRDHFVAWKVIGGPHAGAYVIAFEDLSKAQGSDRDFNDLVFQVSGVIPAVPEPSSLVLAGGAGALGLLVHAVRRRRPA